LCKLKKVVFDPQKRAHKCRIPTLNVLMSKPTDKRKPGKAIQINPADYDHVLSGVVEL